MFWSGKGKQNGKNNCFFVYVYFSQTLENHVNDPKRDRVRFFFNVSNLAGFRELVVRAYGTWSLGGTGEMNFFPFSCKEIRNISLTINYEYRNIY